ncbi:hypothetical protein [Paraburkholderia unamae]|uniref:hypothetical protein n=1 Tax=Paraburkholderia unamae TaxID=219649 RepID=UPI001057C1EB|nr:hypothetical protein [Paraburkholderia unamae]
MDLSDVSGEPVAKGGDGFLGVFEYCIEEQYTLSAATVSKSGLLTAAEIARLQLPGLPTTKANVIVRAEKEHWYFEEATGLGGRRKLFAVPERYWQGVATPHGAQNEPGAPTPVDQEGQSHGKDVALREATDYVRKARAQGGMSDAELVQEIVVGVERWLERNKLSPSAEKKAALISLLFKYFQTEGALDEEKLDQLLTAVA